MFKGFWSKETIKSNGWGDPDLDLDGHVGFVYMKRHLYKWGAYTVYYIDYKIWQKQDLNTCSSFVFSILPYEIYE